MNQMSNLRKPAGLFEVYVGDEKLPRNMGIIYN